MFCTNCGRKCNVIPVDFGIGPYEYAGFRGVDKNVQDVSDCCEDEVVEELPQPDCDDEDESMNILKKLGLLDYNRLKAAPNVVKRVRIIRANSLVESTGIDIRTLLKFTR